MINNNDKFHLKVAIGTSCTNLSLQQLNFCCTLGKPCNFSFFNTEMCSNVMKKTGILISRQEVSVQD